MKNITVRTLWVLFLVVMPGSLTLSGCIPKADIQPDQLATTPRILVISAFADEMKWLRSQAEIDQTFVLNGRSFETGLLAGQGVILVVGGVSMVNAASTTQAAIDAFQPMAIIFTGIAGGVNPDLKVGDVAIPAQWAEYQEQVFARESSEGWQIPPYYSKDLGNFEMMHPQKVAVTRKDGKPDRTEERLWFPVDPKTLEKAKETTSNLKLERCLVKGICLDGQPRIIIGGNGLSGPTFMDNAAYREWVWEAFQADVLDMESAAVAHVAYIHGIPFLAVRAVSDIPGETGYEEQMAFYKLAADNAAIVLLALLEEL